MEFELSSVILKREGDSFSTRNLHQHPAHHGQAAAAVTVLIPAVIEADPRLCHAGHGDATDMDHVTLHLQVAAPVLVLARAVAELQIVPFTAVGIDLAHTAPILGAHPVTDDEDTRAQSAALLPGKVITGGQGGPGLAPQATGEEEVLMLAGSGANSPPHL